MYFIPCFYTVIIHYECYSGIVYELYAIWIFLYGLHLIHGCRKNNRLMGRRSRMILFSVQNIVNSLILVHTNIHLFNTILPNLLRKSLFVLS